MPERPDLRSEEARTPGPYRHPADRVQLRNVYRRADGSIRHGCTWTFREAADAMRECLPGETFVECRDMASATDHALLGVSGNGEG